MLSVGIIIIGLTTSKESLTLFVSDSYFAISIVFFIIGFFGLILKNGTFDFFYYSFIKTKEKIIDRKGTDSHKKALLPEREEISHLSNSISNTYISFIKTGVIFLVFSILSLLLYYSL